MSTWIIFRREVSQYFSSPFAYLIGFAILFFTGLVFTQELTLTENRIPDPAIIPRMMSFLMVFFAPLLTMRLLAEEQREGTLELLLTAPVPDGSIVIGKFLGAWFYYTVLIGITLAYQIILTALTAPDLGTTIAAYLGIWLYGGATIMVGLLFSALTENQIVAAFFSMITLLILWLADSAGQIIANIDVARAVRALSLQGHFSTSFAAGLVRMEDVAYFVGIIILMVFLATRVVEANRWR
ncbi:MAG: ABC transporter permease [bacterium]|nr:ABC transporter permease [bacterium]